MYTKSTLASQLSKLAVGDQFWFWSTSNAEPAKLPLIIQPMSEDEDMIKIHQLVKSSRSLNGIECLGVGRVLVDGTLQLQAERIAPVHAVEIAMWALGNRLTSPDLSILRSARFVCQLDGEEVMQFGYPPAFQPAAVWGRERNVKGRIQETLTVISDMKKNDEGWFALFDSGDMPQPHFIVWAAKDDPEMHGFKAEFIRYRERSLPDSTAIVGMLKKVGADKILLTPFNNADGWRPIMNNVIATFSAACPEVKALQKAEMFAVQKDQLIAWENPIRKTLENPPDKPNKTNKLALPLKQFAAGEAIYFWFGKRGTKSRLLLDSDRKRLKAKAQAAPKMDQFTRGSLETNKNGGIDFIGRRPYTNFVNDLIAWYQQQPPFEELGKLHGSRFIQRDSNGKPVDRQRNPQAWNQVK